VDKYIDKENNLFSKSLSLPSENIMSKTGFKNIILSSGIVIAVLVFIVWWFFFSGNVSPAGGKAIIYIPEEASYQQVLDSLKANLEIRNIKMLDMVAMRKKYPELIKPGRYVVENKISYVELINMLRSGRQKPVKVTFNNIRNIYQLAGKVGGQIEADSAEIADFLSDTENYKKYGFTRENVISIFIPNTYEFYWNTSAQGFYRRMLKEYNKFWEGERDRKAAILGLTRIEVSILASIVDDEVTKGDEKPRIAGVYLNRLKNGMPLQACPTIKFALNDFTITRVLKHHLEIDSPYNTYKYKGFPPGPIGCPTIEGIDAVLNAEKHNYFYFAAKADFSGYHNFSKTLAEHNRYAAQYQKELDKRRIFR